MGETRYYYFRFKEDFFEDDKIIKMQGEIGGDKLVIILLKMLAHSIKGKGIYRPPCLQNGNPDLGTLARKLREDIDTLGKALEYFNLNGLMEIIKDDNNGCNFKFAIVEDNIGVSPTKAAERKRLERERKKLTERKSKEIYPEEPEKYFDYVLYGKFENVKLTEAQHDEILSDYGGDLIDSLSMYKASTGKSYVNDYATLLSWAKRDGLVKCNNKEASHSSLYNLRLTEAKLGFGPSEEDLKVLTENEYKELMEIADKVEG